MIKIDYTYQPRRDILCIDVKSFFALVCQHLIRQLFKGLIICILVAISNRATREYESYCTN